MNEECLELEDQVSALKVEVKEAWGSYKNAQERAALREAELQDEIRQVCVCFFHCQKLVKKIFQAISMD